MYRTTKQVQKNSTLYALRRAKVPRGNGAIIIHSIEATRLGYSNATLASYAPSNETPRQRRKVTKQVQKNSTLYQVTHPNKKS
jgi:hypothetical protein